MQELLDKYCRQKEFDSYDEFYEKFELIIPQNFNFGFDVVDAWAKNEPDKTALVYTDDHGMDRRFTFLQMKDLSNRAANYFQSKGIGKGDVVMLVLKRRYQYWYLCIALHKIGALCVPATEQLKQSDYEYRLCAAGVKMIVAVDLDDTIRDIDAAINNTNAVIRAKVGTSEISGWDDIDSQIEKYSEQFEKPSDYACGTDIMLMYFTSGTTGYPKIVAHDYNYPLGHITTAKYWQNCQNNGLHFTVAEIGWAKCGWGKLYGQWICGSAVMVYDMDRFDAERLLEVMQQYPITSFCAPPTIFRFLIRCNLTKHDLSHIQSCTTAGEALNPEVYEQWLKKTGMKIREGFGQTESAIIAGTFKWMESKPGSMGRPNPLYRCVTVSGDGRIVGAMEEGQIAIPLNNIKPPSLIASYYHDDERTEEIFQDGIYYTGDLAFCDEDGYLWYIGRVDDIIKTSGYRVGPFEVENALMRHPSVLECAITGVPDEIRGQVIKGTIVLNRGFVASEELKMEIQHFVKEITAPYKYPRVIDFVENLPKTVSGKVQRYVLRKQKEDTSV